MADGEHYNIYNTVKKKGKEILNLSKFTRAKYDSLKGHLVIFYIFNKYHACDETTKTSSVCVARIKMEMFLNK